MSERRIIVVTGGTGALGSVVCETFAAAGDQVIATAHRAAEPPAPGVEVEVCDLRDESSALDLGARVRERHGRCDALVCTAGGFAAGTPVHEAQASDLRDQLELNLMTGFLAVRALLPLMLERGDGAIVLVGSRAGLRPFPGGVPYAVAKSAVHALASALAVETRRTGVRVNAVIPSSLDTAANRAAEPGADHTKWVPPERFAATVQYLCSPAARDVSGALVPIYGDA